MIASARMYMQPDDFDVFLERERAAEDAGYSKLG